MRKKDQALLRRHGGETQLAPQVKETLERLIANYQQRIAEPASSSEAPKKPTHPQQRFSAQKIQTAPLKAMQQTEECDDTSPVDEARTREILEKENLRPEDFVDLPDTPGYPNYRIPGVIADYTISDAEVPEIETLVHLDHLARAQCDLIFGTPQNRAEEAREEFEIARKAADEFGKHAVHIARARLAGVQRMFRYSSTEIGLAHKIEEATKFGPNSRQMRLVERVRDAAEMFKEVADGFHHRSVVASHCVKYSDFTPYTRDYIKATRSEVRTWKNLEVAAVTVRASLLKCADQVASTNTQVFVVDRRSRKVAEPNAISEGRYGGVAGRA